MNKEDLLQQKCVIWFKNNYQMHGKGLIFAVPNGGTRNIIEAKKLKATGTMPGVSDLIVVLDSKVLFIELKTDIGKQSDAQIIFETKITNLNHEYILIKNEEEFKNAIFSRIGNREK
ncbi:VRR-NUC domain-containing protein [Flavobacterium phage vB_FspS_mymlan6-2]|uniref:VRR-NUC domain-containing protein n=8 Tax=Muminvirus TaxID=2843426 RepID=A0A6B9LJS9_9CAUD|nr:VRR-NUC domain-containing protein [Flavobacterium phage vB_FspS_mymlan6-1]QHB39648.1 VRR-NUC domain-containing protein [Flavobacterium phage vB_FspS_mumin6-1]QHB39715.1 VRR-NUC domain-containing protein [Flavobacterium phage vB_FspS_mumin6-2]QHB39781.1 VRR-NUC domain-containing protein [Flavobacterium phage vB_FspS_mumin6-3]QHB39847.1 VRR-NUC domain-containing protein [Flavobacterium phage vB_FspS_mumin6-4]QHB39981.1 VRR-NUC domain-containing protein [Flavobacterium phage vB_FspS_mumin9-2]